MSTKRKNRVTHAGRSVTIYRWTHPTTGVKAWRYVWTDAEGKRHYVTSSTMEIAETSALNALRQLTTDATDWLSLPPARLRWLRDVHTATPAHDDDQRAVLEFLRNRSKSGDVAAAVASYLEFKITEAGQETPHLRTVRLCLEGMATSFPGSNLTDIHAADLAAWWKTRGKDLSAKRRKDIRGTLVSFWKWAQRQGIAGTDPVTVAERLPTPKLGNHDRQILTPDELREILRNVSKEWRAWVILGAFAGLRPEEIAPKKHKIHTKRGIHCNEIDFQFNVIRLPAAVAKGGSRPRNIPLNAACRAGLEWAGIPTDGTASGKIVLRNPSEAQELARLGKLIFGGPWPQDALRHSYGSYRNAQLRNLPQVAEEMGNSVAMLNRHYHNPRTEQEGAEWFSILPPYLPAICGSSAEPEAQLA